MKHSVIVHRLYQQHEAFTRDFNQNTAQSYWEKIKGRKQCTLRIEKYYKQIISFDLVLQCCVDGVMQIRPPQKIVLSITSKKLVQDQKELVVGLSALKMISGQKSQSARARKSIAAFKLREGSVLGCKTTLRGKAIYSFLDKLIFLALPRARVSIVNRNMDGNNNYNIGISDPFVFMELEGHYDLFQSLQGINIALVNSSLSSNCSSPPLLGNLETSYFASQSFKSEVKSQVTSQASADQRSATLRPPSDGQQSSIDSSTTLTNDRKVVTSQLLLSGLQIQVD